MKIQHHWNKVHCVKPPWCLAVLLQKVDSNIALITEFENNFFFLRKKDTDKCTAERDVDKISLHNTKEKYHITYSSHYHSMKKQVFIYYRATPLLGPLENQDKRGKKKRWALAKSLFKWKYEGTGLNKVIIFKEEWSFITMAFYQRFCCTGNTFKHSFGLSIARKQRKKPTPPAPNLHFHQQS